MVPCSPLMCHCKGATALTTISALCAGEREKWKLPEFIHKIKYFSALLRCRRGKTEALCNRIYCCQSPPLPSVNKKWPNLVASAFSHYSQAESIVYITSPLQQYNVPASICVLVHRDSEEGLLFQAIPMLNSDLCSSSALSRALSFALHVICFLLWHYFWHVLMTFHLLFFLFRVTCLVMLMYNVEQSFASKEQCKNLFTPQVCNLDYPTLQTHFFKKY